MSNRTGTKTAMRVYLSYSARDEALKEEFVKHLQVLQRQGEINSWHSRNIDFAKSEFASENDQLDEADVVLLLISADFVSSEYCYAEEITRAVTRHDSGQACVIPVILRPVLWKGTPFGKLNALPAGGKPVTNWSSRDEAFFDVVSSVMETAERHLAGEDATAETASVDPRPDIHGFAIRNESPASHSATATNDTVDDARLIDTVNVPKVFVSSTFVDLQDHRKAVIRSIRRAGLHVDPMEDWTADATEPKEFSQQRVLGCELCVLLVALRRGYVPAGESRSITQMEYDFAIQNEIEVLVYMLDENAPWSRKFDELAKDEELGRWRTQLGERHGVEFFKTAPESIDVGPALARWLGRRNASAETRTATSFVDQLADAVRNDAFVKTQAAEFQRIFQDAVSRIQVISDHKDLHDLLHELQVHSYNVIVQEQEYFPDKRSLNLLREYDRRMTRLVDRLDMVACSASFERHEVLWIAHLRAARQLLCEAVDESDADKLKLAIRKMKTVLATQPSKIDARLGFLANELRLGELARAVSEIGNNVESRECRDETTCQFHQGAEQFRALDRKLETLVKNHRRWQELDDHLRRVEDLLVYQLDELSYSWPDLLAKTESLCESIAEEQARHFRQEAERVQTAIASDNPVNIRETFRGYRALALDHFYEADKKMRDLCGELRMVGEPLHRLLHLLGTE